MQFFQFATVERFSFFRSKVYHHLSPSFRFFFILRKIKQSIILLWIIHIAHWIKSPQRLHMLHFISYLVVHTLSYTDKNSILPPCYYYNYVVKNNYMSHIRGRRHRTSLEQRAHAQTATFNARQLQSVFTCKEDMLHIHT